MSPREPGLRFAAIVVLDGELLNLRADPRNRHQTFLPARLPPPFVWLFCSHCSSRSPREL
jgi:hypothetical protein